MSTRSLKTIVFVLFGLTSSATIGLSQNRREPGYKLNATQTRVVELFNLTSDGCLPDRLSGRVVKRVFDARGLMVTGITLESRDGTRDYINVEPLSDNVSQVAGGWIGRGLQTLLREGQFVSLSLQRCGAAGRVLTLDSVRPAR